MCRVELAVNEEVNLDPELSVRRSLWYNKCKFQSPLFCPRMIIQVGNVGVLNFRHVVAALIYSMVVIYKKFIW
jgi:hypothetical protein